MTGGEWPSNAEEPTELGETVHAFKWIWLFLALIVIVGLAWQLISPG
jgi:hypothetical protein